MSRTPKFTFHVCGCDLHVFVVAFGQTSGWLYDDVGVFGLKGTVGPPGSPSQNFGQEDTTAAFKLSFLPPVYNGPIDTNWDYQDMTMILSIMLASMVLAGRVLAEDNTGNWYTIPGSVQGPQCITSFGEEGNCVGVDSEGLNAACHAKTGYFRWQDGLCGANVCPINFTFLEVGSLLRGGSFYLPWDRGLLVSAS